LNLSQLLQTDPDGLALKPLVTAAAIRRDRAWGRRVTFSPKVFLPLTNLCRNRCDYCAFRKTPGDPKAWTMTPDQVLATLDAGAGAGCTEALFCLGDPPERAFPSYRRLIAGWGHSSTVAYLVWAGAEALKRGLLPHTNAGILTGPEMAELMAVNASLGLMLESTADRLTEPGQVHHAAPDKAPARRLEMTAQAGRQGIPFTSGLLVGIGETRAERVKTLVAIDELHRAHGHIQEVIVQNFRAHPGTPLAGAVEPSREELAWTVAAARILLSDDIALQAPPNLNPASLETLLASGLNDLGGISPVTPDYINPLWAWPQLRELRERCGAVGFELVPRLPVYPRFENHITLPLATARTRRDRFQAAL
jgi:FO synthase